MRLTRLEAPERARAVETLHRDRRCLTNDVLAIGEPTAERVDRAVFVRRAERERRARSNARIAVLHLLGEELQPRSRRHERRAVRTRSALQRAAKLRGRLPCASTLREGYHAFTTPPEQLFDRLATSLLVAERTITLVLLTNSSSSEMV